VVVDPGRRAAPRRGAGELSDPAQIARQVKRMTADPKARRLATEFFGQWLGFYHFDEYRGVDTTRFPEFTNEVRSAMYDEAISTFEYLVREGRPVKEILHADYAFLNKPLAKFYGIETEVPSEDALVKVDGAGAFNRGGALRLGSVLTTTSAPLRTSPVKRGDWVLRRVLGTPDRRRHPGRGHAARRRQELQRLDAAGAAGRAQAQRVVRRVPPAHRSARLPARRVRPRRPSSSDLCRRQTDRSHR
jgi:hypothetical protein